MTPFPGTELYARAAEFGEFDPDWGNMNLLNVVFIPYGLTREDLRIGAKRIDPAILLSVPRRGRLWQTAFVQSCNGEGAVGRIPFASAKYGEGFVMKILVLIPAYNEEARIGAVVQARA